MRICIDWGNTLVKIALYDADHKLYQKITCWHDETLVKVKEIFTHNNVVAAILCSVSNASEPIAQFLEANTYLLRFNHHTPIPIMNAYHSPETLGLDRLAMVIAVQDEFPGKNNLVVALGTCITYNFIHKNNTYRGGAISPGMAMRFKAMHTFTDKLPEVSEEGELILLGYDTDTCMRSGVIFGMAAEIDGIVDAYASNYPDFNAVLTGGDAPFFVPRLKSRIFATQDLVLKGLYITLKHNVPTLR